MDDDGDYCCLNDQMKSESVTESTKRNAKSSSAA